MKLSSCALLGLVAVVSYAAACDPSHPLKTSCRDATDCNSGNACTDGVCVPDPARSTGGVNGTGGAATGGNAGGSPGSATGGVGGLGTGGAGVATGGAGGGVVGPNCTDWTWEPVSFGSSGEAQAAIAGRWVLCAGTDTISLPSAPFPSTFEITADSHWYGLVKGTDGTYQRSMAFGNSGTVTLYGTYAIGFSGHNMGKFAFSSNPKLMNCGGGLYAELP